MEQPIQPQQPIIPQDNKNKTIVAVVVSVLITALVVGAGVYFFTKQGADKVVDQQNTQNSNEPTPTPTNNNVVASGINLKDYSLVSYPFTQSPAYKQLSKACLDRFSNFNSADLKDVRLVKNGTEIVSPSLKQLIRVADTEQNQANNWDDCYSSVVDTFSVPANGNYLYLKTSYLLESDAPNSGLSGLYRLDLSNLSAKKLTITEFLSKIDLYRGSANDSYKLLADGKRVVKWNMDGVYLINLETDSKSTLYSAPQNQWLISSIEFGMGQIAQYDVKINGNQAVVGVYDKTKTQEGYPIKVDQYGNVTVESSTWNRVGGTIKPKLINHITVSIPN